MDVPGGNPDASDRTRPGRTATSIDEGTWEYWWALNKSEYLPIFGYEHERDGQYAEGRNPAREAAVDLLLGATKHTDNQIRTAAVRALASVAPKHRAQEQTKALLKGLSDSYREVREAAGLALAERGVRGAAPRLRKVAADKSLHRVQRAFAALALIRLEDEKGIELALSLSNDPKDPALAGALLIGLGHSGNQRFTRHLMATLDSTKGSNADRRRMHCDAMMALGKLGNPIAVGALIKRLDDRERIVQRAAALALGGFKANAKVVNELKVRGLASKDALTRSFAAISLARIAAPGTRETLQALIAKDKPVVEGFSLLGLGLVGDKAAARVVLETIKTKQRKLQFGAAAIAAGMMKATAADSVLSGLVGAKGDPRAEAYALIGMSLMPPTRDRSALRKHLWTNSATIQYGVPMALASVDAQATADWLGSQLRGAGSGARRAALVAAVSIMGGSNELPVLVDLFKRPTGVTERARVEIINAIAKILARHEPSFATRLRTHTYYPFNNEVLAHLVVFP